RPIGQTDAEPDGLRLTRAIPIRFFGRAVLKLDEDAIAPAAGPSRADLEHVPEFRLGGGRSKTGDPRNKSAFTAILEEAVHRVGQELVPAEYGAEPAPILFVAGYERWFGWTALCLAQEGGRAGRHALDRAGAA